MIGACAAYASTGRITPSLMLQLAMAWSWVPLIQFLVARVVAGRRGDLLLTGARAPWFIWMIGASAAVGTFGFAVYAWAVGLALVPIAFTARLIYRFCTDVMGDSPRRAMRRTLMHQALTWLVAALYLDRAVSLWPRILGWLS